MLCIAQKCPLLAQEIGGGEGNAKNDRVIPGENACFLSLDAQSGTERPVHFLPHYSEENGNSSGIVDFLFMPTRLSVDFRAGCVSKYFHKKYA